MEVETVFANYLTKGEHVDGEEKASKQGALMQALVDWSWGGTGVSNGGLDESESSVVLLWWTLINMLSKIKV